MKEPEFIDGFPFAMGKSLLRIGLSEQLDVHRVIAVTGLNEVNAERLLSSLEARFYLRRVGASKRWLTSLMGKRWAAEVTPRRIPRESANRKVREMFRRIHEVNLDEHWLYFVWRAWVVGQYLTDADDIDELVVLIELERKEQNHETHLKKVRQRVREAGSKGRRLYTFVNELFFGQTEIRDFIKARSKSVIVIVGTPDDLREDVKCSCIYSLSDLIDEAGTDQKESEN